MKTTFIENIAPNLAPDGIDNLKVDADLQVIVERWTEISKSRRAGTLAIVMASSGVVDGR